MKSENELNTLVNTLLLLKLVIFHLFHMVYSGYIIEEQCSICVSRKIQATTIFSHFISIVYLLMCKERTMEINDCTRTHGNMQHSIFPVR